MSYFAKLQQSVVASTGNSYDQNLDANGASGSADTFTGTGEDTLGVAGIQITLKTDQNCMVQVQQSPNNTDWDISDEYNYYASIGNFGITVQAVNSYVRVVVQNLGSSATTYFRLQTCLCPIVEAVPRSLDDNGHLMTAVHGIKDEYGFEVENTPMGEMRVAEPIRLVGAAFDLNGNGGAVDSNFWTASTANSATVAQANANVTLSSGTNSAGTARLYSVRRGRYVSGVGMCFRAVIQVSAGIASNKRRWGIAYGATMPTITDGAYFELDGTTFSIVTMKGSSEARVSSGSFNGTAGATYSIGTTVKTYEIYWTNSKVYFTVAGEVLHTVNASSATWSATMSHFIYMDNVNSGSTTNCTLDCRVASIRRLGSLLTQPNSYYHALGTTAGQTLKFGAGNIHYIVVSSVVNNAVITLSDSTTTTSPVIWAHTATATAQPLQTINLGGAPFFNGLRLTVSGANASVVVIYE